MEPPARLGEEADVVRVVQHEMEPRLDLAHLADRAGGEHLAGRDPSARGTGRRTPPTGIRAAERAAARTRSVSSTVPQSGFSQNTVLPGLQGGDRPVGVQPVRERDVHGLDVRVGDHGARTLHAALDALLSGPGPRPIGVPAADRHRDAVSGLAERREERALRDARRAEDPPPDLFADSRSCADPTNGSS